MNETNALFQIFKLFGFTNSYYYIFEKCLFQMWEKSNALGGNDE